MSVRMTALKSVGSWVMACWFAATDTQQGAAAVAACTLLQRTSDWRGNYTHDDEQSALTKQTRHCSFYTRQLAYHTAIWIYIYLASYSTIIVLLVKTAASRCQSDRDGPISFPEAVKLDSTWPWRVRAQVACAHWVVRSSPHTWLLNLKNVVTPGEWGGTRRI